MTGNANVYVFAYWYTVLNKRSEIIRFLCALFAEHHYCSLHQSNDNHQNRPAVDQDHRIADIFREDKCNHSANSGNQAECAPCTMQLCLVSCSGVLRFFLLGLLFPYAVPYQQCHTCKRRKDCKNQVYQRPGGFCLLLLGSILRLSFLCG